jgi:hypothetical protein
LIHIGEILLQTTDIYLLIEKLIDIYSFIIQPNENLLYNGEICQHIKEENKKSKEVTLIEPKINLKNKECDKNKCKLNYISINEMLFINTGFNIFITLIYLKDMFPNHQKLSLFDLNLKKSHDSQFLKMNKIKKRNQKEYFSKEILINKNEFNNYFHNDFLLRDNISELNNDNSFFGTDIDRKIIDNTELNNSDLNLHEISILEENTCSKLLRCLSCGYYNKIKKSKKNKTFEQLKNHKNYFHISTNNSTLSFFPMTPGNDEITNLNKRFISKYRHFFNDAYIFYSKHTSSVEISVKDMKYTKYFKIPFIFINLTNELKLKIISGWKSTVKQSNLREILNSIDNITQILNHKQKLRKYHLLFENLKPFEIVSYIFTLIFNIIFLIFTTNNDIEICQNNKRYSCSYINSNKNQNIKYKYIYMSF